MLELLRTATGAAHARLDLAFGAMDLHREDDCRLFLSAHAMALRPLMPLFARFVQDELGSPCPDYLAMLERDLAERGCNADSLPLIDAPREVTLREGIAGLSYVIAGSRLGNAVIRRAGYAGRDSGRRSRYMEDDTGHDVWKALAPWLRACNFPAEQREQCKAAALATFTTFENAHAASANMKTPATTGRKEMRANG